MDFERAEEDVVVVGRIVGVERDALFAAAEEGEQTIKLVVTAGRLFVGFVFAVEVRGRWIRRLFKRVADSAHGDQFAVPARREVWGSRVLLDAVVLATRG